MSDPDIFKAQIKNSVQSFPDAKNGQTGSFFWGESTRSVILPSWGTRERERWLRLFYRHEYNWMGQSAFAGLSKKWAATKWEVRGKYRVTQYQNMLRNSEFGIGWDELMQRVGLDFLRQDGGAYIELVAPGRPDKAPTGRVVGLTHLDSLRCFPTGDPEYPVIYYNRLGKMHLLHRARVLHLVDAPDGDDANPGYGLCALTRAISIVQQQIHMMRYIETALDEKPPPGMVVASNINKSQRDEAFAKYLQEQMVDSTPEWGRTAWFYSIDPASPAKLDVVSFSTAPENWSYKEYTELHVNAWAMALGVDVQELWQLTGGNIGSGAQSQVLHAKSQGKTYGAFLSRFERAVNDILPETLTFSFQLRDPFEELEKAQVAKIWGDFAAQVKDTMTLDEQRRMLAEQVEPYQLAVTDESGQITTAEDLDIQTEQQVSAQANPDPATHATTRPGRAPNTAAPAPKNQVNANNAPPVQAKQGRSAHESGLLLASLETKAIKETLDDFEAAFVTLARQLQAGEVDKRQAEVILRGSLARYGKQAYLDGLTEGGVESETLSGKDVSAINAFNASQRAFVTNFLSMVKEGSYEGEDALRQHAVMWGNKSVLPMYQQGLASADANGLYEWVRDPLSDSCVSCLSMEGQRHRLSEYAARGIWPRGNALACHGYNCKCGLKRVSGKARGAWL